MSDRLEDGGIDETVEVAQDPNKEKRLSKKAMAIILASVLIVASVGVWYVVFRHWSIHEFGNKVVYSEWAPGFDPSLAGSSVFVEGRVTEIKTYNTT